MIDLSYQISPTPTLSDITLRRGGFVTISDALDYAATGKSGTNFYSSKGLLTHATSYKELRQQSLSVAAQLLDTGAQPGEFVGIIAETNRSFQHAFYACQYIGLIPVPISFNRYIGGHSAYLERVNRIVQDCRAKILIAPSSLIQAFRDADTKTTHLLSFAELDLKRELRPEDRKTSEIAYIQYSSGSSSFPKGVIVTQTAATANATAILRDGLQLRPDDRANSWLPFYHDMGLMGFMIAPMFGQCSVDYMAPSTFVRRPTLWLELISRNKATISFAPPFGYEATNRALAVTSTTTLDLSCWRVAGIGGDTINAAILAEFAERTVHMGFGQKAFAPSYGMAEATLAISMTEPGAGLNTISISETGPAEPSNFVKCGKPLRNLQIRVADQSGYTLPDGVQGELQVKGDSVFKEYLNQDEQSSSPLMQDGYFKTGDLGFIYEGQIIITGRLKDLIIVNGRNVWPDDIEWIAQRISGIGHGDVVAFEGENLQNLTTPPIVVLIHIRGNQQLVEEKKEKIRFAISEELGVSVAVHIVSAGAISLTSSGKIRRSEARRNFLTSCSNQHVPADHYHASAESGI
ncbi:AMP-binding protein [Brucella sp. NM4]|uniref:AMP-binding protein n=1 Tax=Brucella sp. NM4 TaxID=3045175 RepID=UPI0024BC16E2|nr:AMP-binding protein [Brucella sp. NM4]WHS30081.1 AMP-binding protein [Brucella sp. NM4]